MRARAFLSLSLVLSILSPTVFAEPTLDRITQNKELVGVLMESYPPFSFLNDKNQLDGFDVDVAKAVADKLGVRLKLETPSWEVIAAGHWQGRYDVCICSMTPSAARAQVFNFPVEYYASPAVVVVNANDNSIKSAADFNGKKIGVGSASTYEAFINKDLVIEGAENTHIDYPFDHAQAVPYETDDVTFQDLALGTGKRLDAVLTNLVVAKERVAHDPRFKITGDVLYAEPNVVATEKGDPQWDARLTQVLAELKSDGTLTRISHKWIGADITQ
ncbi:transporter substrate-binding domain-containing protein [Pseudomonas sp. NPDC090202]|uniref:transporter substrate-binding domain-containing protein n=1 Tax=Pseudomonas sp. NPDC090202 TaxID=3364476 RepID=UPI0037F15F2C